MHYEVDMDNCYAAIIQVFKCQVDETHGFMISTNKFSNLLIFTGSLSALENKMF